MGFPGGTSGKEPACHHKIKYSLCCIRENMAHPSRWFPDLNKKVSLLYNDIISCG